MIRPAFRLLAAALAIAAAAAAAPAAAQDSTALAARTDSIFAQWDRDDSPGCALGVYRDGRLAYARGYGMADLERGVRITPSSLFDIGSTSKQFAAASIVLLEQDGKLSLDDDVRTFIPELRDYGTPITIRQLLVHTSGLRDYIGLLTLAGERFDGVTTPQDALDIIGRQRELNFAPGSEHLYSNSGYFLLSIIVERVAGQSLRDFARERIFAPLGMARTHYLGGYDDVVPGRALAYERRGDGTLRTDIPRWLQLGDGAVWTSVEELQRWDENSYQPRVGGARLLDAMHTRGRLDSGRELDYALGLFFGTYRGQQMVSHGGAWGGYRAELMRFPDQHFSVAVLCNLGSISTGQLARRVADVHLADVLAPLPQAAATRAASRQASARAVRVPERALRELAGTYRHPVTRALRTIEFEDGRLWLPAGGQRYEMRPRSATLFELVNAPTQVTLAFGAPTAAAPRTLTWTVGEQPPLVFEWLPPFTPSATELAAYTGTYYSEELDATWRIVLAGGTLTVHRRGAEAERLLPVTTDEFTVGSASARFTRAAGGVDGFTLALGRIRNLRFDRTADGSATLPDTSLTRQYTAEECPPCEGWNAPQRPVHLHGGTWYVGTRGLGAILITSDAGHVLIDAGLPNSAPAIMENVRALGFRVQDVRLIVNSHAHYDHAGGIAAIQRASGARVAASEHSAPVLARGTPGRDDPQYAVALPFPGVARVERFADGDTVRVGDIVLVAHLTPGHTPGGTTWSWQSCDGAECLDFVYADSQTPVSADEFRYSDSADYPNAVTDFRRSHVVLEQLRCDVLITPHPGASQLWERLERGREALVDAGACRRYAANARAQLERRLEREAEGGR